MDVFRYSDDLIDGYRRSVAGFVYRLGAPTGARVVHLFDAEDPAASTAVAGPDADGTIAIALRATAPDALDQLVALLDLPPAPEV
ncbi:MAG: hypothetical protein CVU56_00590 [Deltaproteobacteria bacterium HGW-Deltaproteobacteria-14]|jgi:hypothetical protein|nr:MAG: hypothetical protein CVU56_00590 [Deltaproteobacteria bacterium HGW-Deltaproteobacteria-14]